MLVAYSIRHPIISLQTKADWHPPANPPTIIHRGPTPLCRILLDSDAGSCPSGYVTMIRGFLSYTLFLTVWLQDTRLGKCSKMVFSTDSWSLNQQSVQLYLFVQNISKIQTSIPLTLVSQHWSLMNAILVNI